MIATTPVFGRGFFHAKLLRGGGKSEWAGREPGRA